MPPSRIRVTAEERATGLVPGRHSPSSALRLTGESTDSQGQPSAGLLTDGPMKPGNRLGPSGQRETLEGQGLSLDESRKRSANKSELVTCMAPD